MYSITNVYTVTGVQCLHTQSDIIVPIYICCIGGRLFTFSDIQYSVVIDAVLFSDFQFSDITAVMHAMPSIISVPDFRLWFGRKLEAKNWFEIHRFHS